jgi:hypothetical protein
MDEGSAIPDVIWQVSEGALTDAETEILWAVFGNPTRNTGRFRECWGRLAHRWLTRQVDSRTAKMANKAQIAEWIEDYGEDSDFVRVRVRGVFPRAGSAQFIDADTIEAARKRKPDVDHGSPLLMGVDIARFGDDKTVIRWRKGRDGRSIPPQKWRGQDTMQTSSNVAWWVQQTSPRAVFIDGNGVGGGVVDRVRELLKGSGVTVIEVQAGGAARNERDYHNKRAECWGELRLWLKTASIDDDNDLLTDLGGVEYGFDNKSRLQLERKEDMKKRGLASPDDGDALSVTFAEPIARADIAPGQHQARVAQMDYSIFGRP